MRWHRLKVTADLPATLLSTIKCTPDQIGQFCKGYIYSLNNRSLLKEAGALLPSRLALLIHVRQCRILRFDSLHLRRPLRLLGIIVDGSHKIRYRAPREEFVCPVVKRFRCKYLVRICRRRHLVDRLQDVDIVRDAKEVPAVFVSLR